MCQLDCVSALLTDYCSCCASSSLAQKQTVRELSRKTPDSLATKLLTASTALRASRKRHLGSLMRCCEAWEPVGKSIDPTSFECIDFHGLSQIIPSLARDSLAEREAEIRNHSGQTEKTMPWRSADLDFALGVPRNQCSAFPLSPMKTATLWKTKMNQARSVLEKDSSVDTIS